MTKRSTSRKQGKTNPTIAALIIGVVLIFGCIFVFTGSDPLGLFSASEAEAPAVSTPASQNAQLPATPAARPSTGKLKWLTVYFTDPNPPDDLANGIDQYVVDDINQATQSIDVASFDFNLPSITNALVEAKKRGVKVRVVVDGEEGNLVLEPSEANGNQSLDALKTLSKAKIKVVDGGRSNGLMHNKIVIIDGRLLYMGSWNLAYNDTFRNNNNLLRITDPDLIANYQAKFNEMFEDELFGANAEVGAEQPQLAPGGVQVENYFSPVDEVMAKIVEYVRGARKSVRFYAFTYTHPDLSDAMIERFENGVKVEGVIENRGASNGAMVPLYCAGLPVMVDGNKYTMHHKVIVIDDAIVITGSFNFTKSADEANDDNILVIHDPGLAALYLQEYQKVRAIAKQPDPANFSCK